MQFEVFTNLLQYGCDSPFSLSVHMVIVTDSQEPTPPEQLDHAPIKSQWGYTMYNIQSSLGPARTIRTPEDTPIQIFVCLLTGKPLCGAGSHESVTNMDHQHAVLEPSCVREVGTTRFHSGCTETMTILFHITTCVKCTGIVWSFRNVLLVPSIGTIKYIPMVVHM